MPESARQQHLVQCWLPRAACLLSGHKVCSECVAPCCWHGHLCVRKGLDVMMAVAAGKAIEDVDLLTPSRMQSPEFASKLAHFRSSPGLGSAKVGWLRVCLEVFQGIRF